MTQKLPAIVDKGHSDGYRENEICLMFSDRVSLFTGIPTLMNK